MKKVNNKQNIKHKLKRISKSALFVVGSIFYVAIAGLFCSIFSVFSAK